MLSVHATTLKTGHDQIVLSQPVSLAISLAVSLGALINTGPSYSIWLVPKLRATQGQKQCQYIASNAGKLDCTRLRFKEIACHAIKTANKQAGCVRPICTSHCIGACMHCGYTTCSKQCACMSRKCRPCSCRSDVLNNTAATFTPRPQSEHWRLLLLLHHKACCVTLLRSLDAWCTVKSSSYQYHTHQCCCPALHANSQAIAIVHTQ